MPGTDWRFAALICFTVLLYVTAGVVPAQEPSQPNLETWWPSPWGADDQAGNSNLIDSETVLGATSLIRTGEILEIGRLYERTMPMRGQRVFTMRLSPPGGPSEGNGLTARVEYLCSEIGQVGTQTDALGHVGVQRNTPERDRRFYNGHYEHDVSSSSGLKNLGIEHMKPVFTRAVLIDVARAKGRMLARGEEISLADVREALQMQNMSMDDIHTGNVVLFNTGWGRLWKVDNDKYNDGAPGIGLEVAQWLIDTRVVLVGSDTWNTEVQPNPDPALNFQVHIEFLTKAGIFIQENLYLEELSARDVFEFAYVYNRVPLQGATGSPGVPLAIL